MHFGEYELSPSHNDRHDGFLVNFFFTALLGEQLHKVVYLSVCTKTIKEVAYVFLEEDNQTDDSHRNEFVHDTT